MNYQYASVKSLSLPGVSKKVASPLKLLRVFSFRSSLFAWNFAALLAIHIHINVLIFVNLSIFHHPSFLHCRVFIWVFAHKMKMQCTSFRTDVSFSSCHVLKSDNCKQSITVLIFYRAMHMHKRGICCHPVSVCLSVRPSRSWVAPKRIKI